MLCPGFCDFLLILCEQAAGGSDSGGLAKAVKDYKDEAIRMIGQLKAAQADHAKLIGDKDQIENGLRERVQVSASLQCN